MATWATRVDERPDGAELSIADEAHTVGEELANHVQLLEVPKKRSPSTVAVKRASDGTTLAEVSGTPTAGEFRVVYGPDARYAGAVEFAAADAGLAVKISYEGTGSAVWARDINALQTEKVDRDGAVPFTGNVGFGRAASGYGVHQLGGGHRLEAVQSPNSPTVTVVGTAGTSTYTYSIVAIDRNGKRARRGAMTQLSTGNATLSATNYNAISWTSSPGAVRYEVLKHATDGTSSLLGTTSGTSLNDTGQATTVYTEPTRNETADFVVDGAVGIGTTSHDGYALYVNGKIRAASGLWVDGVASIEAGGSDAMKLAASRFEFAIGNVGVGTTSPSTPLHVYRAAYADALTVQTNNGTTTMDGARIVIAGGAGTFAQDLLEMRHNSAEVLVYNRGDGAASHLALSAGGNTGYLADIIFRTDRNSLERMRLVGATGNLGIGTTNPAGRLEIAGGAAASVANPIVALQNDRILVWRDSTGALSNPGFLWYDNANSLSIGVSNATRMRITPEGYVGVGTTNPAWRLDVTGAVMFRGTGYGGTAAPTLYLQNQTATTGRIFGVNSADNGSFQVYDASAGDTTRLSIEPGGSTRIHGFLGVAAAPVSDSAIYSSVVAPTNGTRYGLRMRMDTPVDGSSATAVGVHVMPVARGSGSLLYGLFLEHINPTLGTHYGVYQTGAQVRNYFEGKIGLGTSDPSYPLHATANDAYIAAECTAANTTGYPAGLILKTASNTWMLRTFANTPSLQWYSAAANATVMVLASNGSIGIGTSSPSYRFHLVGTEYASLACFQSNSTLGAWVNIRNTDTGGREVQIISSGSGNGGGAGNMLLNGALNVAPGGDNNVGLGTSGLRWTAVYAVNGTIQTSQRAMKELHGELDPELALAAVRALPIHRYTYKGNSSMRHVGVVMDELPEWMWTDEAGQGFNYNTLTSVNTAAIRAVDTEVLTLRVRVAELERQVATLSM